MPAEERELEKLIEKLDDIKGRGTELVTVYVPAGYSLNEIADMLRQEKGTAENIKSKQTRKNVQTALDKIVQHLKVYNETPDNGLAIFCGNVSESEGKTDIQLWATEPPQPLGSKDYWCDQKFDLGPLKEMVKETEVYGLLVLDSREADLALLQGKSIDKLSHIESPVPGKQKKGGQSAQRFERQRQGLLNDHLKKVADHFKAHFSGDDVLGVIVGGPGPIKDKFLEEGYLSQRMREKVLGTKNTGYTGDQGLEELLNRAQDILREAKVAREKELMEEFLEQLHKDEKAVYGLEGVKQAIKMGAAETVLVSDRAPIEQVKYQCECGNSETRIVEREHKKSQECSECSKHMEVLGEKDMVAAVEELAATTGAEVEVISRDTTEGEKLFQLGGIGAILRFKFNA